jgi:hypothetical protein
MGDEDTILTEYFESLGYRTRIVTLLLEGSAPGSVSQQFDAILWRSSHHITNDVLWDGKHSLAGKPFADKWPGDGSDGSRGFPQWFIVDTNTMRIWDSQSGYAAEMHTTSYLSDILDICKEGSGWTPDDAGVDGGLDSGL